MVINNQNQENEQPTQGLSRRGFLGVAATVAGGTLLPHSLMAEETHKLGLPPGKKPSRVVLAEERMAVDGHRIHTIVVKEMLEASLIELTQQKTILDAWMSILKPNDIIGLKFNQSSQEVMGTTKAFAKILIGSLVEAGYRPGNIVCIEAPPGIEKQFGTQVARRGFDLKPVDFGSGSDHLASVLGQITALISVPYLKTHNIAGMTCSLKNLSHAFVKHPARYHRNHCSPFIGDIVNLPEIRSKLKLCIVDALRVVFDKGPEATSTNIKDVGAILTSADPVSTDTVGLSLINRVRRSQGMTPRAKTVEKIGYLVEAHRRGVGVAATHGIDLVRLRR